MSAERKSPVAIGMSFGEALKHFVQSSPGELAEAITRDLIDEIDKTRKQIRIARGDINRGARTVAKKDRFRL